MERPKNMDDFLNKAKRWAVFPRENKITVNRCLFSGRMDPLHAGHWVTILRLLKIAKTVVVVVLDYPGRKYYAGYTAQLLEELTMLSGVNVEVHINHVHFAKITAEDFDRYKCGCYAAAGNFEVLENIWDLGKQCIYVDRAYDYEARNYIPTWKSLTNKRLKYKLRGNK